MHHLLLRRLRRLTSVFMAGSLALLASCDQVDYRKALQNPTPTDTTKPDTTANLPTITPVRKVLLYDFTGHTCGNCPNGHDQAKALQDQFDARFGVMSIHCGGFAVPFPPRPDSAYGLDLRTPAGDALDDFYRASAAGLPRGVLNGKATTMSPVASWANITQQELQRPSTTGLTMSYAPGRVQVNLTQTTPLAAPLTLTLYRMQDSIRGWQKDYRRSSNQQNIRNYFHRHVLRESMAQVPAFVPAEFAGNRQRIFNLSLPTSNKPWLHELLAVVADPATGEVYQWAIVRSTAQ